MFLKLKGLNNFPSGKSKHLPNGIEDKEIHEEGKDMEDWILIFVKGSSEELYQSSDKYQLLCSLKI